MEKSTYLLQIPNFSIKYTYFHKIKRENMIFSNSICHKIGENRINYQIL